MNVLVTGAFGNIGEGTVAELSRRGHRVRCFDVPTKANLKKASRLGNRAEVFWGDLREPEATQRAAEGMEVVIHLAFVIPKLSATGVDCEDQPDWAWEVNVGGTRNLLEALKSQPKPPAIIFASSLHIYGITTGDPPPRRVTDPLKPIENYARHKVACEELVRSSGLRWSIFRFAAALPFSLKLDPALFEIPLSNRMEYVHNRDVGLALANGVDSEGIWGKILHIGGGERCHYTYGEIVGQVMDAVGVGMLPEAAFSSIPFSTDWIDTGESQRLLHYQRHTLEDFCRELAGRLGVRRTLVRLLRPLVRALLLSRSPYHATRGLKSRQEALRGQVALLTCAGSSFGAAVAKKLAHGGMHLVLLQKPGEDLQQLLYQIAQEGGRATLIRADLSSGTEDAVSAPYGELLESCGPVSVLVNHADLVWINGHNELERHGAWERIERDFFGVLRLTQLVTEDMRRHAGGHLIYLEPALKLFPARPGALLLAARSFFRTYSQRLGKELQRTNVRVSLVKAGIPTTELLKISRLLSVFRRRRSQVLQVRPEALANRVWTLLIKPEPVIYVPNFMRLFSWLEKYAGWFLQLLADRLLPARVKAPV
jgi:UDP-glucose 4-epimerase